MILFNDINQRSKTVLTFNQFGFVVAIIICCTIVYGSNEFEIEHVDVTCCSCCYTLSSGTGVAVTRRSECVNLRIHSSNNAAKNASVSALASD